MNHNFYKIPAQLFEDTEKRILKCTCKGKFIRIDKTILKKNNKVGGTTLPDLQLIA